MTNPTGKGGFQRGRSGNPGGRPKLPAEMREMFRAKAPEAFEVLSRHLQSPDAKVGDFRSFGYLLIRLSL